MAFAPLARLERGDAWAELHRGPGGAMELRMGDRAHRVIEPIGEQALTVFGSDCCVLAGRLPDRALSAELVGNGERYPVTVSAGHWLAAIPREAGESRLELVARGARGARWTTTELGDVVGAPPRPSIPRPEYDPMRAPVTLRREPRRRLASAAVFAGFPLALAVVNFALTEPGYGYLALALALPGALLALPGIYALRLERSGFGWRGLLGRANRFVWGEVSDFYPVGAQLENVGFGPTPDGRARLSARIHASVSGVPHVLPDTYGMAGIELAALMNAWREHYFPDLASHSDGHAG